MDSKLWRRLTHGRTKGQIKTNARDSSGMSLSDLVSAIGEGEELIIPEQQQILPFKIPLHLDPFGYFRFIERFRSFDEDQLESWSIYEQQMTPEEFERYGPQFNLERMTKQESIDRKATPQRLMVHSIRKRRFDNLSLDRHFQLIASIGFHWMTTTGNHVLMGLRNLLEGWNLTSLLLNMRDEYQIVYSNPPSGFWMRLPSTDPNNKFSENPREAPYKVRMVNFATFDNMSDNYANWNKLIGAVNEKNLARNVNRYEMPFFRVDHRIVAGANARIAFSDSRRHQYGLYEPVVPHGSVEDVKLNIAITPSKELTDFYVNMLNNVLFEGIAHKVLDGHMDAMLSYYMHGLTNYGLIVDDALESLDQTVAYFIESQQRFSPKLELNPLG